METSVRTIRRINVMSALKVGAIATALVWAILGLIFVIFSLCFSGMLATMIPDNNGGGAFAGGLIGTIIFYVIGIVLYGIIGGVVSALYAWIYNLTAGWVGGLEIELSAAPDTMPAPMAAPTARY